MNSIFKRWTVTYISSRTNQYSMKKHYAVDLDDVLCDFVPILVREFNKVRGSSFTRDDINHWIIGDIIDSSLDELSSIAEKSGIFHTLTPRKELSTVKSFLIGWHDVTIVTNRFRIPWIEKITKSWLAKNWLRKANIIFSDKKWQVVADIAAHEFADDCLLNALDVATHCHGVRVWLPDRPWNGEWEIRRIGASGKYQESVIRRMLSDGRILRTSSGIFLI